LQKAPPADFLFTAYSVATQHSVKTQQSVHDFGATKVWREILFFRQRRRLTFPWKPHKEDLELLLETSQLRKQSHHHMIFCVQCFCQRGGFSFILCELIFGTAVLRPLLLHHAHLMIVQDSPRVADVSKATALTVNQYHSELWKRLVLWQLALYSRW
jgi:hypothetical protein